jgi:phosphonate transport system substrate-binding protein
MLSVSTHALRASAAVGVLLAAACAAPAATTAPAAATTAPAAATTAPAPGAPTPAAAADPRAGWPTEITLGLFGSTDAADVIENNKPVAEYIEQKLGVPVKYFTGTSYSAVIEAMRAKRVDAMQVGPFSYLLAVQEAGAEAIGISVTTRATPAVFDDTLRPAYFSVISTKKGSGIASLQDLRGKNLNFVDPASTSGYLVPKTNLLAAGINPDKDLKTVFAGAHPTSVLSLWGDKADAAASTEATLYNLAQANQIEFCGFPDGQVGKDRTPAEIAALYENCPTGKIAMVAYSDPIPNTPIAVRGDLPDSFKTALKDALLAMKDAPDTIAKTKRWYLDPSKERGLPSLDAYYNPLREIAKALDLDLKTLE